MANDVLDHVARRWGVPPDDAVNYATIPAIERRALSFATQPYTGMRVEWTPPYRPHPSAGVFSAVLDQIHPRGKPIQRLLSLCCGHGHGERTFPGFRTVQSCEGLDISGPAIERAEALARDAGLDHFHYRIADINQLKLEGTYDFVYAAGVHHLENLEHVFAEVREHLEPGAPFMMYEYVGPRRCQYTQRQVEIVNACIRLMPERLRVRVTSQRELGVASPADAYALLQRQRAQMDSSTPIAADVFALDKAQPVGGSVVERLATGLRIITPTGPWEYSVMIPKDGAIPECADDQPLMLAVDVEVRGGVLSIGLLAEDMATFLHEFRLEPGPRTRWSFPIPRAGECRWLVVRNGSSTGASGADLFGLQLAQSGPADVAAQEWRPLSTDPRMRRHFLNEFILMTPEQWIELDPSESVRSDEIIPLLRSTFSWVDVRYMRSSILQFALHDLAANFYEEDGEARDYLEMLFHIEDVALAHDDVTQNYAYIVAADRDLLAGHR